MAIVCQTGSMRSATPSGRGPVGTSGAGGITRSSLSWARLKVARKKPKKRARDNRLPVEWRRMFESRGIEVAFILSPNLGDARMKKKVRGEPPLRFFDFNDPAKYPELYKPDMRYDRGHLTYVGSQIFTRKLAAKVAARLEK